VWWHPYPLALRRDSIYAIRIAERTWAIAVLRLGIGTAAGVLDAMVQNPSFAAAFVAIILQNRILPIIASDVAV
jgi:hypothetical protein